MPPTHPDTQTFTRPELYDLVWSTPIVQLSKTLGISGPGLAKLCRRHNIPCPPRGYWAKLRHGKDVSQAPLPESTDDERVEIRPTPRPDPVSSTPRSGPTPPAISVESELRNPHPLVRATRAACQPGRSGREVDWSQVLDLRSSKSSLDRALRIWDALIKAIEARGGQVAVEKRNHRRTTTAVLGGDPVPISMREKFKQTPNPEYTGEQDWIHPKFTAAASGLLSFRLGDTYYPGMERSWTDGKRLKLEVRLHAILAEITQASAATLALRQSWEAARLREEQQARERAEREERERILQAELSALIKQVDAWRRSREIRAMVRAAQRRAAEAGIVLEPGNKTQEWIEWAWRHAERLDPLMR